MLLPASCHICRAVPPTKVRNMAANSSFGASSSAREERAAAPPRPARAPAPCAGATGAPGVFSKWVSRMASCAVPGSSTTALRGFGSGIFDAGAIEDVDLAVGPQLELVDVGLGLRARAAADLTLPEGRAEGHAEVGALAPVPDEAVGAGVVEHAEEVVHVGVVDQELAVLVLEREELGMQRVGALHDPVQREAAESGSPTGSPRPGPRRSRGRPVAWRTTSSAAVCAATQASNAAFRRSSCIRADATQVSAGVARFGARPVTSGRDRHRDRDDRDRRAAQRAAGLAGQQLGPRPDGGRVVGAPRARRLGRTRPARQRLRQGHGPLRRRPGAAGGRNASARSAPPPGWGCSWPPRPSPPTAPRSRSTTTCATSSPARRPGASSSASPRPARTWPACRRGRSRTATSGSSTARRSGPRAASTPTSACSSPAPTPRCPSTRASPTSPSRCSRTASTCAPSRR